MKPRICELCSGQASLYCASDSAFLCIDCDANVHEANFLVARHVRRTLCRSCNGFDGNVVSSVGFRPIRSFCRDCEPGAGDHDSAASSSSSTCVSTAESWATTPPDAAVKARANGRNGSSRFDSASKVSTGDSARRTVSRAEGILVNWSRKMGLRNGCSVALGLRAYWFCARKFTSLPPHVALAASLWCAAKRCEPRAVSTCQLMKLQQCSRAPAKLILLVERRLSRLLLTTAKESSREEGWAECPHR